MQNYIFLFGFYQSEMQMLTLDGIDRDIRIGHSRARAVPGRNGPSPKSLVNVKEVYQRCSMYISMYISM